MFIDTHVAAMAADWFHRQGEDGQGFGEEFTEHYSRVVVALGREQVQMGGPTGVAWLRFAASDEAQEFMHRVCWA